MPEMPTLGASPKQSPVVPIAITAVVVGLLMGENGRVGRAEYSGEDAAKNLRNFRRGTI